MDNGAMIEVRRSGPARMIGRAAAVVLLVVASFVAGSWFGTSTSHAGAKKTALRSADRIYELAYDRGQVDAVNGVYNPLDVPGELRRVVLRGLD